MDELAPSPSRAAEPRWRPISAIDRRVLGVLVEKAKTTPDAYPMSINALRAGMNQKSNRYPLMEVEPEDLEEALERLRGLGAVTEVSGGSRVARYRHHLYEWLGADKVELSVMAELLLRGAQTEGELRARAARMDPIPDLNALRTILAALETKGLTVSLTPKSRGHVLTHALYEPRELEKLRAEYAGQGGPAASDVAEHAAAARPAAPPASTRALQPSPSATMQPAARESSAGTTAAPADFDARAHERLSELRGEVDELRAEVSRLRREMDELLAQLR